MTIVPPISAVVVAVAVVAVVATLPVAAVVVVVVATRSPGKFNILETKMRHVFAILITLIHISNSAYAGEETKLVEKFVNAFNQKDVDTMLALSSEDLRWMSISGQQISVQTSTQEELHKAMTDYFNSTPTARSEIRTMQASGPFVYALEEAFWSSNGVEKSQCSMAVYELQAEKILNVWYFPEHQCE